MRSNSKRCTLRLSLRLTLGEHTHTFPPRMEKPLPAPKPQRQAAHLFVWRRGLITPLHVSQLGGEGKPAPQPHTRLKPTKWKLSNPAAGQTQVTPLGPRVNPAGRWASVQLADPRPCHCPVYPRLKLRNPAHAILPPRVRPPSTIPTRPASSREDRYLSSGGPSPGPGPA